MKKPNFVVIALFLVFLLIGCTSGEETLPAPQATATQATPTQTSTAERVTNTPIPTDTLDTTPSHTPEPTNTQTPRPTKTSTPTLEPPEIDPA